jgi:hypothetical protein
MTANTGHGLIVRRGGFAWLRGSTTISENGLSGIYVENAALDSSSATIVSNSGDGILADNGANVILRNTQITGNAQIGVSANLHSVVDFRSGTQVMGNSQFGAFAGSDSVLRIYDSNVVFFDHIYCGDTESSFENRGGATHGGVSCTGFNWWD